MIGVGLALITTRVVGVIGGAPPIGSTWTTVKTRAGVTPPAENNPSTVTEAPFKNFADTVGAGWTEITTSAGTITGDQTITFRLPGPRANNELAIIGLVSDIPNVAGNGYKEDINFGLLVQFNSLFKQTGATTDYTGGLTITDDALVTISKVGSTITASIGGTTTTITTTAPAVAYRLGIAWNAVLTLNSVFWS